MMRRFRPYAWSFVDQGSSSITNLGLSVVAARTLGAGGLGATLVGFSAYLLLLGIQRAAITEPLVTVSTRARENERRAATRAALTCALLLAGTGSLVLLAAGVLVPGLGGKGTLLFTPWLAAALLQDFWRAVLFRDERPAAAALTDVLWLGASAAAAPLAFVTPTLWTPSIAWGLGAVVGAATGSAAMRVAPTSPVVAASWYRSKAWPFGRWLAAEAGVYNGTSYALVWALTLIIGTSAYGGLRAAYTVFGPLSVLAPLVAMPGLPAMSRSLGRSLAAARGLALRLSAALVILTTLYVVAVASWPSLLGVVFGGGFLPYRNLAWPVGLTQIVTASAGGLFLLMKAQQRGPALTAVRLLGSVSLLAFSVAFAYAWGVLGAAWAGAAGLSVFSIATFFAALGHRRDIVTPATAPSR